MKKENSIHSSPLRYPGGKGVIAPYIKLLIEYNKLNDGRYVEVYAGGAGIAWHLLFEEYVKQVHINDLNLSVWAFWNSVLNDTEKLCKLIYDTPVTLESWKEQKHIQLKSDQHSTLALGFSTFFLNRTTRSGILTGGIIGGKNQTGQWKIDARYNKEGLIKRIQRIANYNSRIELYRMDAAKFIETIIPSFPEKTLIYFDPPYFGKGAELYQNHYSPNDHAQVAKLIDGVKLPWIVSYDSCEQINSLYSTHRSVKYDISYSAREKYKGKEVMFFSDNLRVPDIDPIVARKLKQSLLV